MALSYLGLLPGEHLVGKHEYRAPGANDLRSPCPFLNTMANHGYIHRDGKRVSWFAAARAIHEVYNFSIPLSILVAGAGWYTGIVTGFNPFFFDLKQQRGHKDYLVEHDASLTRQDYPNNNWQPDPELVHNLIAQASSPEGLSIEDFARHRIVQEAKLSAPLSSGRHTLATGEVGLILPTLGRGDPDVFQGRIKPEWIESFFQHERLPDDWTRPKKELPFSEVNAVAAKVRDAMAKYREGGKAK